MDAELVTTNPCSRVRKFRLNNRRLRFLSTEEEIGLFRELEDNPLLANLVRFALNTGLRRGEIFDLEWRDVDFRGDLILVRKTKADRERFVPMNPTVKQLLLTLRRTSDHVFPNPKTGAKLNDIKTGFRGASRRAGIINFRFHDLRHTAATRMAEGGADAFTIMEILGHSDIRTTVIYTHARIKAMRQAVANTEQIDHFSAELAPNGHFEDSEGLITSVSY